MEKATAMDQQGQVEIGEDATRLLITLNRLGDSVQFTRSEEGGLHIEVDEPWAGDTESGFGQTSRIYLPPQALDRLSKWLIR